MPGRSPFGPNWTVGVSMLLEAEHLLELARRGGRLGVVVAAEVDPADEDIGHLARVRGGRLRLRLLSGPRAGVKRC